MGKNSLTHSKPRHTASQHSNLINRTNQPKNKSLEKKKFPQIKSLLFTSENFSAAESKSYREKGRGGVEKERRERGFLCERGRDWVFV